MASRRLKRPQRELVAAAEQAGWRTKEAKHGTMLFPSGGQPPVCLHGSPKQNGHAHRNMVQTLRRYGLEV